MFGRLVRGAQTGFEDAMSSSLAKGYRYPVEIISHCVAVSSLSSELAEVEVIATDTHQNMIATSGFNQNLAAGQLTSTQIRNRSKSGVEALRGECR